MTNGKFTITQPGDLSGLKLPQPGFWVTMVLAIIAGALLPLAFAPFSYPLVALLAFMLLLYTLLHHPQRALWLGFAFGMAYFGVGVSWVSVSMHNFGNMPLPLAYFATFLFVLVLALFPAVAAWLSIRLRRYLALGALPWVFWAFPASWIALEWLRSWILTGFPWLIVGVSQVESPIGAMLPVAGELAASYSVLVFAAMALLLLTGEAKEKLVALLVLAGGWLSLGGLEKVHWTVPTATTHQVVLVQGNTALDKKWDPVYQSQTIETYLAETQKHLPADIVVWPETAMPLLYPQAQKQVIPALHTMLGNTSLISGVIYQNESGKYHNSLFQVHDKKEYFYHKRHLVPFGEYTPLADHLVGWVMRSLQIPMSNLVPGKNSSNHLVHTGSVIAPSICYEVAYSRLIRKDTAEAGLLLTVSNDTWFGDSFAAEQHLQIAQARARENGKPMVRSTNTGITAFINAKGQLQKRLPQNKVATLVGKVTIYQGGTPYARYGEWPLWLCVLGLGLFYGIRKQRT